MVFSCNRTHNNSRPWLRVRPYSGDDHAAMPNSRQYPIRQPACNPLQPEDMTNGIGRARDMRVAANIDTCRSWYAT
jgi:hypothetical protein